jgi:hypothetical protein
VGRKAKEYLCPPEKPIGDAFLIDVFLPIVTVSEANGYKKPCIRKGRLCYRTEHWTDKHKRHKRQKYAVKLMLNPLKCSISLPCTIILTRHAPRKLDKFDNLPMSLKWVLDAICEIITGDNRPGRADSHEGISVVYEQVNSKDYGVRIQISCE